MSLLRSRKAEGATADPHAAGWRVVLDARIAAILVFSLYGIVVLATFEDYGITTDEPLQAEYGEHLVRWYGSLFSDESVLSSRGRAWLYGGLFETVVHGLSRLSPLPLYETRHLLNAVVGILGVLAAYKVGTLAGGAPTGALCALFLVLAPRYYGHSFNNSKDLPFAVGYIWSLYFIIRFVRELPCPSVRTAVYTGLAIGLTLAVRVNGVLLFGYLFLSCLASLVRIRQADPVGVEPYLLLRRLALLAVISYATMVIFWPWAQVHPVSGPIDALRLFSSFAEEHFSLFRGQYVSSLNLPRTYALSWLSLTLPEATGIGLACLIAAAGFHFKSSRLRIRNLDLIGLLALAVLLPLVFVVLNRTPLYDGLRHLLFVRPPLSILAAIGVISLYRAVRTGWIRWMLRLIPSLALAMTAAEMIRIHPYQSSYFNYVVAGTIDQAWQKYDTDYWQSSYKEGLTWILEQYPTSMDKKVRVAGLFHGGITHQLESDDHVAVYAWEDPDVYMGTTRYGDHRAVPGEILHRVKAGAAELLYIVRPDSGYSDDPFFQTDPFIDNSRLRILARSGRYFEEQGDSLQASNRYREYAKIAARMDLDDAAIRAETRSIYLLEQDPVEINTMAEALLREGRYDIAESLLKKLVTDHPEQRYYKNWLIALASLGSYETGLRQSRLYNRVFPNDADGLGLTALMLLESRAPDAREYLDSLKATFPDHAVIQSLIVPPEKSSDR